MSIKTLEIKAHTVCSLARKLEKVTNEDDLLLRFQFQTDNIGIWSNEIAGKYPQR